jgi:hypothetical protein
MPEYCGAGPLPSPSLLPASQVPKLCDLDKDEQRNAVKTFTIQPLLTSLFLPEALSPRLVLDPATALFTSK